MEKAEPRYDSDRVAGHIFQRLIEDFRLTQGHNFAQTAEKAFWNGVKCFREYEWPTLGSIDPYRYKQYWQLQHTLKKYRFKQDAYTDEELERKTNEAFEASQIQLNVPLRRTAITHAVLQEARKIARSILGDFDKEELASMVRWGRRASIGCGYKNAYIDYKLTTPEAFTCSSNACSWFFKEYKPSDVVITRLVKRLFKVAKRKKIPLRLRCDVLKMVNVPKSWNKLRGITPLTLIGLFYSYGYGSMVSARLKTEGLDIAKLQYIHQMMARIYSKTRKGATVDLTNASNSIISELLNCVLPRPWYVALRETFVRNLEIDGRITYTVSVLPMGNGATFPVETLVFYCLIKAVGNLLDVKGFYSVYGDDLIYPSRIHAYVARVFGLLGLGINVDKTFVSSHFRESCGGDFYHGIDVRPFFMPDALRCNSRTRYLAYLYKVYNGLCRRWDPVEIPGTIKWLQMEILSVSPGIHQVPLHWPDESGVKVDRPVKGSWYLNWYQPVVSFENGSQVMRVKHLSRRADRRFVIDDEPYYWQSLSGSDDKARDGDWREYRIPRGVPRSTAKCCSG
nr:MAG: RNA dependent RNA polymerase [Leviviridae sp.]